MYMLRNAYSRPNVWTDWAEFFLRKRNFFSKFFPWKTPGPSAPSLEVYIQLLIPEVSLAV